MRWGVLWLLLPDEVLPLIIVGVAFALMFGLLSLRGAVGLILALVVLPPVLAPFVEGVLGDLPPWVSVIILAVLALAILRGLAALVLGRAAAAEMVGHLAADLVKALVLLPLRGVRWVFRAMINLNGLH